MNRFQFLLDRTAVLFLGLAAGAAIGIAFAGGGQRREAVMLAPAAAPIADAPAAVAPPPPTDPAVPAPTRAPPPAAVAEPIAASEPVVEAAPPTRQIADTVRVGNAVRIGVFGDSFGDGIYSGLYRLLPARDGFQVEKFSQPSTGFTRYRRLDLEAHDDSQIGAAPLDIAVIAFGANDAQGVCDAGHCGALMSSYWQQVIGRRVEAYVAMLRRHGASVYWIGLPAMRDGAFDSDAVAMDAFYRATMQRLDVPFVAIRSLTVDRQGRYQAYYLDGDGKPKLLRADDGIHMSMNGYVHVTKALAGRIRATVTAARATAPAADDASQGQSGQ